MIRTSFSQNLMFHKCAKAWYMSYIRKIKVFQEMCFMHAGTVVHGSLEKFFKEKPDMDIIKKFFEAEWAKYALSKTKIADRKEEYWEMVVTGMQKDIAPTSCELKVFFPDCVAYFDIVDTENGLIGDWKTGMSKQDDEMQMRFYAWMYKRKFGQLPKKAELYYLKHSSTKPIDITESDAEWAKEWHENIQREMEVIKKTGREPPMCDTCYFFCPYKDICMIRTKEQYTLTLRGSFVYAHFGNNQIDPLLDKRLHQKFSYELKNAYYIKKRNPMASTIVNFWKHNRLPIGFLEGLTKTLNDFIQYKGLKIKLVIKDMRSFNDEETSMPDKLIGKELRPYQEEAVESILQNKIGLLEIGTGGGKTEIAIECMRRINGKTLFIVDRKELMQQTKKRIEDTLGIEVGEIGSGKNEPKFVTVCTIQTLNKRKKEMKEYLASIKFAIFDECHKVAANSYLRLSCFLTNTRYRMGISGTCFRDDGEDLKINAVTGDKIFDLGSKKLISMGFLVQPHIIFIKNFIPDNEVTIMESAASGQLINPEKHYIPYYKSFIMNNIYRNNIIRSIVVDNADKKILILVKYIEHGTMLSEMLKAPYIHGNTPDKKREKAFDEFVNGELNLVISTMSIWAEGIDCKRLGVVINAGANAGQVKTIQMLGRSLRTCEGKTTAYYYDFLDESKFFKYASYRRKKALTKEGFTIEEKEWGEK